MMGWIEEAKLQTKSTKEKRPSEISDGLKYGNRTDVGLHLFF